MIIFGFMCEIKINFISPQGVVQVAMAVEMKSHQTGDLGFNSFATLPGNGVNLTFSKYYLR